jgi:hypothetical protein
MGVAPWGIVTNGKVWRLYSAKAHSRATNYYEVDLEETLGLAEPGVSFRYFYLFFRAAAFAAQSYPISGEVKDPSPFGLSAGGKRNLRPGIGRPLEGPRFRTDLSPLC